MEEGALCYSKDCLATSLGWPNDRVVIRGIQRDGIVRMGFGIFPSGGLALPNLSDQALKVAIVIGRALAHGQDVNYMFLF